MEQNINLNGFTKGNKGEFWIFQAEGINFKDITTLLKNAEAFVSRQMQL